MTITNDSVCWYNIPRLTNCIFRYILTNSSENGVLHPADSRFKMLSLSFLSCLWKSVFLTLPISFVTTIFKWPYTRWSSIRLWCSRTSNYKCNIRFDLWKSPWYLLIHPFDNYVTHTFWSWSLALISKLRKVIGSRFMRARLPGQMT
jgi:hypothetical protein